MALGCSPRRPGKLTKLRVARPGRADRGVETNAEIDALLAADAPVAFAVSGGKDSQAGAIACFKHLDAIGHKGPRALIHSDLGDPDPAYDVEWAESLPVCQRLADRLGVELLVTRRAAGGMMKRWIKRWENSQHRYANLLCVKMILPWSTPSMRFCTSELKSAPMAAALVRRFAGHTIVSACGVRRDESDNRSDSTTTQPNTRLLSKKYATSGIDWNPIAHWSTEDVFAFLAAEGVEPHEGYTRFGMKRISCRFCIMQDKADRAASAANPEHHPLLRTMASLEVESTFGFQGNNWLADERPDLVDPDIVTDAKRRAMERMQIEARVPKHLLYTKGWPTVMPTADEAQLLSEVRTSIAALMGIEIKYATAESILARYAELMALKAVKDSKKARKAPRKD